jgi:hypothetical protein
MLFVHQPECIMTRTLLCALALLLLAAPAWSQKKKRNKDKTETEEKAKTMLDTTSLAGLKFRSIGPALTSGRISDFAMHPDNPKVYYIASASGGV